MSASETSVTESTAAGKPVGFGMIGLGVGRSRVQMVQEAAGADLRAVCDLRPEVARQHGEEWNCAWTTSYEELIQRDDVDVVGIFTPSGTHGDLAIAAASAGKHVITTKPPEVTVAKVDAMAAAARQAGVLLAVDFVSRYTDAVREVKLAIDSGRLGRPIFGDMRLKWYRAQSYFDGGSPPGWRGSWRYDGGGSLANQGIHDLDLLQWFMGPATTVQARINIFNHRIETEDACQVWVAFESGAWGSIETTTTVWGGLGRTIEVHGTNGTMQLADRGVTAWHFQDEDEGQAAAWAPELPSDRPANVIEDILSALHRGTPLACPIEEGRKAVALLEAIYASAKEGSRELRVWG